MIGNNTFKVGLSLHNIHKNFGDTQAVKGISFDVGQGEVLALLGPSGCGKSTTLGIIAGLEPPDQGDILWDGESLQNVPPHRRGFGLMFQDFALFPHMNVFDNVAFGLRMVRMSAEQIPAQVAAMLELVGLSGFNQRDVNTLSGGEQQRVALARSLAPQPRLLMLDEPLGSLDRNLRERLVLELGEILRKMKQTAIYVTHDQEEAFSLADRIVVMNAGRVEQIGTPKDIYSQPGSTFVARFLGLANILKGEVIQLNGENVAETAIGRLPVHSQIQGKVTLLLRPDAVRINEGGDLQLKGKVVRRTFRGSVCRATIEVNGVLLEFDFLSNALLPIEGETLRLSFDSREALQVLEPSFEA